MITLTQTLSATPEQVYTAWLSSQGHSDMTGSKATASNKVGDEFTAWDGYLYGKNLKLALNKKIVQSWRTNEFPEDAPDSILTITLEATEKGTKLTLKHADTPDEQEKNYEQGWQDHYFEPMEKYFASL